MLPVPIGADALPRVDLCLITHAHTDHMDPSTLPALASSHPLLQFVVPAVEGALAASRGVPTERTTLAHHNDVLVPLPGVRVDVIPSAR
jgi:L-ascorbate metabolism protein UlaG (beta-lactamase superfamily)